MFAVAPEAKRRAVPARATWARSNRGLRALVKFPDIGETTYSAMKLPMAPCGRRFGVAATPWGAVQRAAWEAL
jgi:hypothetical protein